MNDIMSKYWQVLLLAEKSRTNVELRPRELREILESCNDLKVEVENAISGINKVLEGWND